MKSTAENIMTKMMKRNSVGAAFQTYILFCLLRFVRALESSDQASTAKKKQILSVEWRYSSSQEVGVGAFQVGALDAEPIHYNNQNMP